MRIDNFDGDDRSYAGFLLELTSDLPLHECILQLETQVREKRQHSSSAKEHQPTSHDTHQPATSLFSPPSSRQVTPFVSCPGDQTFTVTLPSLSTVSKPPQWVDRTRSFLENLPASEEEWSAKRQKVGLNTEYHILDAYDKLTGCSHEEQSHYVAKNTGDKLDLSAFAKSCGAAVEQAASYTVLSQVLCRVFIATCIVALKDGEEQSLVDQAQRDFWVACGKSGEQADAWIQRDRSIVQWELHEQQRQFRQGLLHRGFEIFANGM